MPRTTEANADGMQRAQVGPVTIRKSWDRCRELGLDEHVSPDFAPLYARLRERTPHAAADVLDTDRIFHRGSREGFAGNADT